MTDTDLESRLEGLFSDSGPEAEAEGAGAAGAPGTATAAATAGAEAGLEKAIADLLAGAPEAEGAGERGSGGGQATWRRKRAGRSHAPYAGQTGVQPQGEGSAQAPAAHPPRSERTHPRRQAGGAAPQHAQHHAA